MLRSLRNAIWARANGRCEVPSCRKIVDRENWEAHVHHRVYAGHGKERAEDLELRCLACHNALHPQHTMLNRQEQESRRRTRRVRRALGSGLTRAENRALGAGGGRWAWRPEASSPGDYRDTLLASYKLGTG